uniref:C2H2-type domain-containing protein n=2 Tax=Cuerna arida TaxID=1464854 RepID=A0A1B6FS64_9HEMI
MSKKEIAESKMLEVIVVDVIEPEECKAPLVVDIKCGSLRESYGMDEWLAEEVERFTEEPAVEAKTSTTIDVPCVDVDEEVNTNTKQTSGNEEMKKETDGIIFEDRETSHADMFICDLCYRIFGNQYKLDSHLFRVHKIDKRPKKRGRKKKLQSNDNEWPPDVQALARRVNGVKTFFCNLCSYKVTRCDSMTKHLLRIHSEGRVVAQYQCEICGKTFVDKAYLRNHGVSHATEKEHTCEVCGRAFHRQPSLKRHRQIHLTSKQFACLLCDYKSNRKHLMYKHAEHHRTGRAYSCKFCSAQFYTQISFRSHMYTHNVSPNSCSFCRVGFSSRERMISHMRKIHFTCEIRDIKDEFR